MNKYNELKSKALYYQKAQQLTNDFPFSATPRKDRHSNYQSIISDLIDPAMDMSDYSNTLLSRMFFSVIDVDDTIRFYAYGAENLSKTEMNGSIIYADIQNIKTDTSVLPEETDLIKVQTFNEMDLRNRLPVAFKESIPKTFPFEVLETNGVEYLISVKERCFLGFELSAGSEEAFNAENFIYRHIATNGDQFSIYNIAMLKDMDGFLIDRVLMLPSKCFLFEKHLDPGIYTLCFDLFSDRSLDSFGINICANVTYSKYSRRILAGPYYTEESGVSTGVVFFKIAPNESDPDNDYLVMCDKPIRGTKGETTIETFTLLNEDNEHVTIDDWIAVEKVLYILSTPKDEMGVPTGNSKLYMYDLFFQGNDYVYKNNDKYIMDLVCEKIDYIPGDTVTIETRAKSMWTDYTVNKMRLKVENSEDPDPETNTYYINVDGNVVSSEDAWRSYDSQEIRWEVPLNNIGSYKFTCETYVNKSEFAVAGVKLLTVMYKNPYKVMELDADYSTYNLGFSPDRRLQVVSLEESICKDLCFYRDGYYFDVANKYIWSNIQNDNLIVEY